MERKIKRGDVYYADLDPVVGSEQGGERPILVIQNDLGNRFSPTVIITAITSKTGKPTLPTHVRVSSGKLEKDSIILLEQVRTVDKTRLKSYIGCFGEDTMQEVDRAIKISMGVQ